MPALVCFPYEVFCFIYQKEDYLLFALRWMDLPCSSVIFELGLMIASQRQEPHIFDL